MVALPQPGQRVTVVKLAPDGTESARYTGTVVPGHAGWLVVAAQWTMRAVTAGPLTFTPGDRLLEYFSVVEPINAFAVFTPDDTFKGWYINVSCPAVYRDGQLAWRDLYLDIVAVPGGVPVVLDEAEWHASPLAQPGSSEAACILEARDRALAALAAREYPFATVPPR